jgi:hypothetical protein
MCCNQRTSCFLAKNVLFWVWIYFITLQLLYLWKYQLEDTGGPQQHDFRLLQLLEIDAGNLATNSSVPTPSVMSSKEQSTRGLQQLFDVISIGSSTRPDYVEAQRRTWASDPRVRSFYHVTEQDDPEPRTCTERLTRNDTVRISQKCRDIHIRKSTDPNFSYYMQRMVWEFARKGWMMKKANPVGWLCAQKRFGVGLVKMLRRYNEPSQSRHQQQQLVQLPSYLLMVDDDTYFNITLLADYLAAEQFSPQDPFVAAGCRIMINRGESAKIFPWGGFGILYSQGALARLQMPISCKDISQSGIFTNSTTFQQETSYEEQACAAIHNNLIRERPLFRDGMSLVDLLEAFTLAEPFEEYENWTTGFCLHGDHFLAYFIEHYHLSSPFGGLQALQNSEFLTGVPKTPTESLGNCNNIGDACNATSSLVCHNQSPQDMARLFRTNT